MPPLHVGHREEAEHGTNGKQHRTRRPPDARGSAHKRSEDHTVYAARFRINQQCAVDIKHHPILEKLPSRRRGINSWRQPARLDLNDVPHEVFRHDKVGTKVNRHEMPIHTYAVSLRYLPSEDSVPGAPENLLGPSLALRAACPRPSDSAPLPVSAAENAQRLNDGNGRESQANERNEVWQQRAHMHVTRG